jgi:hypothetical protein
MPARCPSRNPSTRLFRRARRHSKRGTYRQRSCARAPLHRSPRSRAPRGAVRQFPAWFVKIAACFAASSHKKIVSCYDTLHVLCFITPNGLPCHSRRRTSLHPLPYDRRRNSPHLRSFRSRQPHRSDGRPPRQHAKSCKPETSECSDRDEQLLKHGELLEPCLRLGDAHEFPIGDQRDDEHEQRA